MSGLFSTSGSWLIFTSSKFKLDSLLFVPRWKFACQFVQKILGPRLLEVLLAE